MMINPTSPKRALMATLIVILSITSLGMGNVFAQGKREHGKLASCTCCENEADRDCQASKKECNQCPTQCRGVYINPTIAATTTKALTLPKSMFSERIKESNNEFVVRTKIPEVPPPKT
jgi:hypothetical protein